MIYVYIIWSIQSLRLLHIQRQKEKITFMSCHKEWTYTCILTPLPHLSASPHPALLQSAAPKGCVHAHVVMETPCSLFFMVLHGSWCRDMAVIDGWCCERACLVRWGLGFLEASVLCSMLTLWWWYSGRRENQWWGRMRAREREREWVTVFHLSLWSGLSVCLNLRTCDEKLSHFLPFSIQHSTWQVTVWRNRDLKNNWQLKGNQIFCQSNNTPKVIFT